MSSRSWAATEEKARALLIQKRNVVLEYIVNVVRCKMNSVAAPILRDANCARLKEPGKGNALRGYLVGNNRIEKNSNG
jgi:hypothetical protein